MKTKHYVYLSVMVELTTDNQDKTNGEVESLAKTHVKNCIMDNPDADDCEVTDCDIRLVSAETLAALYNDMTCAEKDEFLSLTDNQ